MKSLFGLQRYQNVKISQVLFTFPTNYRNRKKENLTSLKIQILKYKAYLRTFLKNSERKIHQKIGRLIFFR